MLDILSLRESESAITPLEEIRWLSSPIEKITGIAKTKRDNYYLLKTARPGPPPAKVLYAYTSTTLFKFIDPVQKKEGYEVSYVPDDDGEQFFLSNLIGRSLHKPKLYLALEEGDLPEADNIRLQEVKLEAMEAMMKGSPEDRKALLSLMSTSGEEDDTHLTPEEKEAKSTEMMMELIGNNFQIARYALSQTATTRKTVEAHCGMPPGMLKDVPTKFVKMMSDTIEAALRAKSESPDTEETLVIGGDDSTEVEDEKN